MKKLLFLILSMILCLVAYCSPIDVEKARRVAVNFWERNVGQSKVEFINVSDVFGFTEIYVFNCSDNRGFVIVSGDDVAVPILGYSGEKGVLDGCRFPENMYGWISHYEDEIIAARAVGADADSETLLSWYNLLNDIAPQSGISTSKSVSPLIQTQWNQNEPYNNLCPMIDGQRAMVGCVATAMAQVMKYWEWPLRGIGAHSYNCTGVGVVSADFGSTDYDWADMPNGPYSGSIWNETQKAAVSTLCYHAGVSLDMAYGSSGSSAYQCDVPNALTRYFGYAPGMRDRCRRNFSDTIWRSIIIGELDAHRPVLYCGTNQADSGGHCFICDGYNSIDQFHFNWGWGGYGDGYFALNSLTTSAGGIGGGSYDFNYNQEIITGISSPDGNPNPAGNLDGLTMVTNFTTDASQYDYGAAITTDGYVTNYGNSTFNGRIGVAFFNSSNAIVKVSSYSIQDGLQSGSSVRLDDVVPGGNPLVSGTYSAKVVYSNDNGATWSVVDPDIFINSKDITIVPTGESEDASYIMEVYQIFALSSSVSMGGNLTGTCCIANDGQGDFSGMIGVAAYDNSDMYVDMLAHCSATIPSNHYAVLDINKYIDAPFSPGVYTAKAVFSADGGTTWTPIIQTSAGAANALAFSIVGNGINGVGDIEAVVSTRDGNILVSGVRGFNVKVFDIMGRMISAQRADDDQIVIAVPYHGVYVVKVESAHGQKILVR